MTTITLHLSNQFLAETENTEYERAYQPLHSNAHEDDVIRLNSTGTIVVVNTSLTVEEWLDRQGTYTYEDGSGFTQRYQVI